MGGGREGPWLRLQRGKQQPLQPLGSSCLGLWDETGGWGGHPSSARAGIWCPSAPRLHSPVPTCGHSGFISICYSSVHLAACSPGHLGPSAAGRQRSTCAGRSGPLAGPELGGLVIAMAGSFRDVRAAVWSLSWERGRVFLFMWGRGLRAISGGLGAHGLCPSPASGLPQLVEPVLWDYRADLDVRGKGQYCVARGDPVTGGPAGGMQGLCLPARRNLRLASGSPHRGPSPGSGPWLVSCGQALTGWPVLVGT